MEKYKESEIKERISLAYATAYENGGINTTVLKTELEKIYGDGKVTVIKNEDNIDISIDGVGLYSINKQGKVEAKGPAVSYTNIRVVENSNGTGENVASGTKTKGTSLYVYFEATVEGGTATITPVVPYEVTQNGTYEFTINYTVAGKNYTTKKSIKVNQYIVELNIGDYVKYESKLGVKKTTTTQTPVTTDTAETGDTVSQSFITNDTMEWRIMDIDTQNNKVTLVAAENVGDTLNNGLTLAGETGFENAEIILNDICDDLYTTTCGIARSITAEDINKLSGFDQEDPKTSEMNTDISKAHYGETNIYTSGRVWNKNPNINKFQTATSDKPLDVEYKAYIYNIPKTMPLYDSLVGVKNNDESYSFVSDYWNATRYSLFSIWDWSDGLGLDIYAYGVKRITSGKQGNRVMWNSELGASSDTFFLRPVIELNANTAFEEAEESTAEKVVWNIVEE